MFDPKLLRLLGLYGVVGAEVAFTVMVCTGGGFLLDKYWHKTPIFTLVGMVAGCVGAGYRLWQIGQKFSKNEEDRNESDLDCSIGKRRKRTEPRSTPGNPPNNAVE
jgi:hypothetical protein